MAMMKHGVLLCGLLLAGCGDSVAVSFGSLAGSYTYRDGCTVKVSGSKGEAACDWTEEEEGNWWASAERTQGTLNFTLNEDSVSGELRVTETSQDCYYSEEGTECDPAWVCNYQITGKVDKLKGRKTSGMFAVLSGTWSGIIKSTRVCYDEGDVTGELSTTIINYVTNADIGANVATFKTAEYRGASTVPNDDWTFEAFADEDRLVVDGNIFKRF